MQHKLGIRKHELLQPSSPGPLNYVMRVISPSHLSFPLYKHEGISKQAFPKMYPVKHLPSKTFNMLTFNTLNYLICMC